MIPFRLIVLGRGSKKSHKTYFFIEIILKQFTIHIKNILYIIRTKKQKGVALSEDFELKIVLNIKKHVSDKKNCLKLLNKKKFYEGLFINFLNKLSTSKANKPERIKRY